MIQTVLDEEKRGTRRKEGQEGRGDGEEGGTRKVKTRPIRPTMRPHDEEMIV